jgi:nucleotide-binding universal stress UspA family protein/DNA-directed RNA polymerase subunit RPC12/RpoP
MHGATNMNIYFVLALVAVMAIAIAAYQFGSSSEPTCIQCPHCRQRQLDRERKTDEARAREDGMMRAFRPKPVPPAEIARAEDEAGARSGPIHKLLVAYDGGDPAKRALAKAVQLARGLGTSICVLSVVPVYPGRRPINPADDRVVHAQQLMDAEAYLATEGVEAQLIERTGQPGDVIARTANEGAFDAVLMGSGRLGGIARFIFGGVPAHVASHTRATVIIVH